MHGYIHVSVCAVMFVLVVHEQFVPLKRKRERDRKGRREGEKETERKRKREREGKRERETESVCVCVKERGRRRENGITFMDFQESIPPSSSLVSKQGKCTTCLLSYFHSLSHLRALSCHEYHYCLPYLYS